MNKKHLGYIALAGAAILALAYALTASYGHREYALKKAKDHTKEIGKGGHHGGGHHGHHGHHHGGHHHNHHGNHHHGDWDRHGNWGGHNWNYGGWNGGYIEGEGIYSPGYIYTQPQQSYYYTEPSQAVPVQTTTPATK